MREQNTGEEFSEEKKGMLGREYTVRQDTIIGSLNSVVSKGHSAYVCAMTDGIWEVGKQIERKAS